MKISFYQQTTMETERQQAEKKVRQGEGNTVTHSVAFAGDDVLSIGGGSGSVRDVEKGKSLIELQQEAAGKDVGISQDYMTLMSHTVSEEDYAKMQEEGFDPGSMTPEETVTIVDKIKAELVRSGQNIAGYTDDLDIETLAAALGSQTLAATVAESFATADIPLTEENKELVVQAWNMAEQLQAPDEGSIRYLIDNGLSSEIWNLYLAENSGAASHSAENYKIPQNGELAEQIDSVIRQAGKPVNEMSRQEAAWLMKNELPLTAENMMRLDELKRMELPVQPEQFARAVADAVAEGKSPVRAELFGREENIYEAAVRLDEYFHSDELWESSGENLTARRQLEEIRLRMTAEVNIKLLKSGFSIDTEPMEKLVEALKQAESELARQYFPEDALAVEKYQTFRQAEAVITELPALPADVLGTYAGEQRALPLEEFHHTGSVLRDTYEKAGESYEALMTVPRRDLGDSMKKAFANVDELLSGIGQELTEENRRATRILGYNRMEVTADNLTAVKEADRQVQTVVEKLTPATVLKMIRDDVNPLEKNFAELEQYLNNLPEEYRAESENYSRFLHGLERNHEITPEERESYIGIYRLLRQIEKADGAVVGALVNTQAELHFSNLLSAVRSGKMKTLDAKVGEETGTLEELVRKGETISEQIGKAFTAAVGKIVTEVSYSDEAQAEYNHRQLEEYRAVVKTADKDMAAMLQRGQIPAGADNLLAARALLEEADNLFARRRTERDEAKETELWELLDSPEDFEKAYGECVSEAKEDVEEETFTQADNSLDVRQMQLTHKQLTVAGALAQNQEFFLPVYIGDRMTRVHLTLNRENDGVGTVDISVKAESGEGIRATFRFANGSLEGFLKAENRNEVMKTERIADIFRKEAGEVWKLGDISVVTTDVRFAAAGRGTDAATDNIELYRVAKSFLYAVQQGEVTDEN